MYHENFNKEKYIVTVVIQFIVYWSISVLVLYIRGDITNELLILLTTILALIPAVIITHYLDYLTDWTSKKYCIRGYLIKKEKAYFRMKSASGYFYCVTIKDSNDREISLKASRAEYQFMNENTLLDIIVRKGRILDFEPVIFDSGSTNARSTQG